jgi:glycosyltransferase involved in cell wall biosynthesis
LWVEQRVRIAYPALKNIKTIPNGVDTTIFYPKNKLASKKALNFPLDKKLILFVAEFSTNNPFKGGHILREIIQQNTDKNLIFITVGGKNEYSFENHITFPFISNREELANLYNACDVLLYPTQADNLPLVVLESMACGTPVIASRLGGIPEIITDHKDGFLINDYKNEKEFIEVLNNYINLTKEQQGNIEINATKKINNYFSLDKMVANYLKLYKEVSA